MKIVMTEMFCRKKTVKDIKNFFRDEFTFPSPNNEFMVERPASQDVGIAVDEELKTKITNYLKRKTKEWRKESSGVSPQQGLTYGGIYTVAQKYKGPPETVHSTYLLADWIDSSTGYIVLLFSTENLLENGRRMMNVPGVRPCWEIDCTYRLMTEGYCLCVIGSVSVDQKFHPVAYAICNHENTAVFQFILRHVRHEIDHLNEKQRQQEEDLEEVSRPKKKAKGVANSDEDF